MQHTISFTEQEWQDLLEWVSMMDDGSFSYMIAELIAKKIKSQTS